MCNVFSSPSHLDLFMMKRDGDEEVEACSESCCVSVLLSLLDMRLPKGYNVEDVREEMPSTFNVLQVIFATCSGVTRFGNGEMFEERRYQRLCISQSPYISSACLLKMV